MAEASASYGSFSREQILAFLAAPFQRWHETVRRVDPLFGFECEADAPLHKFKVTVAQEVKMTEHATFEIDAYSEADAEKRVDKLLNDHKFTNNLRWREEDRWDGRGDMEIVDIEAKAS